MKKEKQVRTYQRKTKSGKVVVVRAHKAKYDAAEDLKKSITKKKGSGLEVESLKNEGAENPFGVETDDFKEWYAFNDWDLPKKEWPDTVRRVDKSLVSGMGKKSYDEFCAKVDESWTARGYRRALKELSSFTNTHKGSPKPTMARPTLSNSEKAKRIKVVVDEISARGNKSYSKEEGEALLKRAQEAGFNMYKLGGFYNGYKFNNMDTMETLWLNVSTDKRGRMHFDTMHPADRDAYYNYYEKERAEAKRKDMERQKARMAAAAKVAKKLPKGSFRTVDENGNEIPGAPKHGTKFKADKLMDKVFSSLDMSTGSAKGIFGVGRAKLYDSKGNLVGTTLDTPNAVAHAMANDKRIAFSSGILGEKSRSELKDRFSYTKDDTKLGSHWNNTIKAKRK